MPGITTGETSLVTFATEIVSTQETALQFWIPHPSHVELTCHRHSQIISFDLDVYFQIWMYFQTMYQKFLTRHLREHAMH